MTTMRLPIQRVPRAVVGFFLLALAGVTRPAGAQQLGRIEGVMTDSVHGKPLTDGFVYIMREAPTEPNFFRVLESDKDGRYRLDSLSAGRYSLSFTTALLDSLALEYPPRVVELLAGDVAHVDFAIPSGATLRRAACPGFQLAPETGAVVGRVVDAESERPLAGATVAVAWIDMSIDRASLAITRAERTGAVPVDSNGVYRLCGVPTGSALTLQVQLNGRAGSVLRTEVPDDVGYTRLDLSYSAVASRVIAAADSTSPADTAKADLLTGTAALTGIVRSATGAPLSEVVLGVVGASGSARSDSAGHFALSGLPAGTQFLEARHIGFLVGRRPVELRSGRTIDVQVRLDRIVSLDSIRIVAQRNRYTEFEQHRKFGFGRYLTEQEIENRHAFETSDLLRTIPGFRVVGSGLDTKVESTRGGRCKPNIMLGPWENQDINLIRPSEIGAMEFYNDATGGPAFANKGCGVIVIWLKR